ncbi:cis-zeatin O-beta-D-glucosyltransferase [Sarracenia purpurea var. burkii]
MDAHNPHPSQDPNSFEQDQAVVIMVPFPLQSHLNQLIQLSCLISSYKIPVYYVASATHIHQAKLRFGDLNLLDTAKIHFHEFPTPDFLSPPPNPNASIKFPTHLLPSFNATLQLRDPMAAFLRRVSPTARRVIVIHDFNMAYVVQDSITVPNAESYMYNPNSAFTYFFEVCQMKGKPVQEEEKPQGLSSTKGCSPSEILEFCKLQLDFLTFREGTICNTSRSIEGTYIDLLAQHEEKLLWAIGPLSAATFCDIRSSTNQHKCLDWLNKQASKSVIYVSFGTISLMADEQIEELAVGLEKSEQKFIWVFRDADKGDIFAADDGRITQLPEGYEERVKEFGIVVRDWAPQVEILEHPSTGGFMSHCGWNSCLESITAGVPVAAWPMQGDQPKNAFLLTEILKVGLGVRDWAHRDELVTSVSIARAVKRLMASKEGEVIRKRAEELGGAVRQSVKEGGISRTELDSFIAHITR